MRRKNIALLFAGTLISTHGALAATGQASFTPTGYKYPIMKIEIMKADQTDAQTLYKCSGATPADCMVDLADADALKAIEAAAQNVSIREGEYSQLKLYTCADGTSGTDTTTIQVKGSVTVGATTYSTSASATSGMVAGNSPEFTDITWTCSGGLVKLVNPVKVAAGSDQTLSLLVDLTYAVWTDASASAGQGGCKADNGGGQDICGSFPLAIPFVGTGKPTYERYLISHLSGAGTPAQADANAAVNVAVDSAGEAFYVGVQPYYSATSPETSDTAKGGPDYNTSTRTLSKNADGSLSFQTGGSAEDNRVGFTAFSRSTHTGTCKNESSSTVWNYKAFKL